MLFGAVRFKDVPFKGLPLHLRRGLFTLIAGDEETGAGFRSMYALRKQLGTIGPDAPQTFTLVTVCQICKGGMVPPRARAVERTCPACKGAGGWVAFGSASELLAHLAGLAL